MLNRLNINYFCQQRHLQIIVMLDTILNVLAYEIVGFSLVLKEDN